MENSPPKCSLSDASEASSTSPTQPFHQQHYDSSNSSTKTTNMLFAFLCEKIGDTAAHQIQEIFKAKCQRLEDENAQLKARNVTLEVENARLKYQMEMKDAIISNASQKMVSPSASCVTNTTAAVTAHNDDINSNENVVDRRNMKNFEAEFSTKILKIQDEFHQCLQSSNAKQDAMESKMVKAAMEIASLKKTIADLGQRQKEVIEDIEDLQGVNESTAEDMNDLIQRITTLERDTSN
uniref:Uncharacterized protein n=1 Tax=Panagrolaimus sp. PS1159 TaxID=55785 RepID=A0AC35GL38_9BILA